MRRHHLGRTASDVAEAVAGVGAFHSSDPITPYLGMWPRVPGFLPSDLDTRLWETRSLWRMHAMRRTLFVVPTIDARVFEAGASREIARRERRRLRAWLAPELEGVDPGDWLDAVTPAVVEALGERELRTTELTTLVPEIAGHVTVGSGKWTSRTPVSSRVLYQMAMEGLIVRTRPAGTWRSSQYHWAAADWWMGNQPLLEESEGRRELLRLYLRSHGPATITDIRWWTGWTAASANTALGALETETVDVGDDATGFVLAGDTGAEDAIDTEVVALLPGLDSTAMGWKERDWYLGPWQPEVFDRNGNAGPTVWVDGRIVGGWGQRRDGQVVYHMLEQVTSDIEAGVADETEALTKWLDGVVVTPRFRTPLETTLSA